MGDELCKKENIRDGMLVVCWKNAIVMGKHPYKQKNNYI